MLVVVVEQLITVALKVLRWYRRKVEEGLANSPGPSFPNQSATSGTANTTGGGGGITRCAHWNN